MSDEQVSAFVDRLRTVAQYGAALGALVVGAFADVQRNRDTPRAHRLRRLVAMAERVGQASLIIAAAWLLWALAQRPSTRLAFTAQELGLAGLLAREAIFFVLAGALLTPIALIVGYVGLRLAYNLVRDSVRPWVPRALHPLLPFVIGLTLVTVAWHYEEPLRREVWFRCTQGAYLLQAAKRDPDELERRARELREKATRER